MPKINNYLNKKVFIRVNSWFWPSTNVVRKIRLFMQNKPNPPSADKFVSSIMTSKYENFVRFVASENKAKQSQSAGLRPEALSTTTPASLPDACCPALYRKS